MSLVGIKLGAGITLGAGIGLGAAGGGGTPGVDNTIGYSEMDPPVTPGLQLEDYSATVNNPIGFTINDDQSTGIAVTNCTLSNINWFNANFTVNNTYTCTWGSGSTVASSPVYVVQLPDISGQPLVFFIQGQTGAATYNYPFTFSV